MNNAQFERLLKRIKELGDEKMDSLRSSTPIHCQSRAETIKVSHDYLWTRGDIISELIRSEFEDIIDRPQ